MHSQHEGHVCTVSRHTMRTNHRTMEDMRTLMPNTSDPDCFIFTFRRLDTAVSAHWQTCMKSMHYSVKQFLARRCSPVISIA
jgi:hypothetical protein